MLTFTEFYEKFLEQNETRVGRELSSLEGCVIVESFDKEKIGNICWVTIKLDNEEVLRVYSSSELETWVGKKIRLGFFRGHPHEQMISMQIDGMRLRGTRFLPVAKWREHENDFF